jgi:hypothetical protein
MASTATSDLIPYSNPNLGFALESIELQKEEGLTFVYLKVESIIGLHRS